MNNRDTQELQQFRQNRSRQIFKRRQAMRGAAVRSHDRRVRTQAVAPTKEGTIAAGAAGTMIGGAGLHAGFKAYNKGLGSHAVSINKHYADDIAANKRTTPGTGPQPGKTGKTYEELMNKERDIKLKKLDKSRIAHGAPTPVKGLKLAGKVGLGALAIGGLAAAGSYGYNKLKQRNEANKPI